jgi:hypothetical protein
MGALLLSALFSAAHTGAQALTDVPFPATKATSITDCSTPTTLNLPGGQAVTLTGGQFIHYTDANFNGTMYATSTAGGCQRMPPPFPNGLGPLLFITFAKPIPTLSVNAYNYVGDDQFLDLQLFNPYPSYGLGSIGAPFPSLRFSPDFPLAFTPLATDPPIAQLYLLTFTNVLQSDGTFQPPEWAFGITSLKIPQGPPDIVKFDYDTTGDDGKILISKSGTDTYPSKYQTASDGAVKVRVSGLLLDGTTKQPKQGKVYLRVDDPPDTAPYRGADTHTDDNAGQRAQLDGEQDKIAAIDTGADGKFETNLTINRDGHGNFVAGDNYQIAGSTDSKLNCPGTCMKSGVFTLWKRIYVEDEQMFREGAFINNEAKPGTTEIPIEDPAPFQTLTPGSQLELVHSDSGDGQGFYFDFVVFSSIEQTPNGRWILHTDSATKIPRYYGAPTSPQALTDIDRVMQDAVGIVSAGTYSANDGYVPALFASAFVDTKAKPPMDFPEVPYTNQLDYKLKTYFASRWFRNATTTSPYSRNADPNVFHRIAVTQLPLVLDKTTGRFGAELGVTSVGSGSNNSLILAQRIEDLIAGIISDPNTGGTVGSEYLGMNQSIVSGEVTAHETVHFWVHDGGADGDGHCLEERWEHDGLFCLMHEPYAGAGLADGLVDLHYESKGQNSEYMTIRNTADPVPLH